MDKTVKKEEYLTSEEVAVLLKISERTAQRLMKERMPHINAGIGTKRENLRVTETALLEYLASPLRTKEAP